MQYTIETLLNPEDMFNQGITSFQTPQTPFHFTESAHGDIKDISRFRRNHEAAREFQRVLTTDPAAKVFAVLFMPSLFGGMELEKRQRIWLSALEFVPGWGGVRILMRTYLGKLYEMERDTIDRTLKAYIDPHV